MGKGPLGKGPDILDSGLTTVPGVSIFRTQFNPVLK